MNVVDLFAGCGGMSLGFQNAGFNIAAAYDNWDKAVATYRYNFSHPAIKADLMDADSISKDITKFKPDMIIGGPPCQDYSSAGKRDEEGGRAILTIKYAEIVCKVSPEWFVMENVHNISKYKKIYEAIDMLKAHGYGVSHTILNAAQCGVPQKRKRFFMVGHKGDQDGFFDSFFKRHLSPKEMTMRDYFGDSLGISAYYRHPRSYARRGIFSIDEPSPTIRGVNRPIPAGYQIRENDASQTKDGIRPLTMRERASVQTFPENFQFFGSKSDIEQMIGNAVPVNLANFVASAIKEYEAEMR